MVVGGLVPGADMEGSIDRSVLLDRPLKIRTPSADSPEPRDTDAVTVSAGAIKTIPVHRVPIGLL